MVLGLKPWLYDRVNSGDFGTNDLLNAEAGLGNDGSRRLRGDVAERIKETREDDHEILVLPSLASSSVFEDTLVGGSTTSRTPSKGKGDKAKNFIRAFLRRR